MRTPAEALCEQSATGCSPDPGTGGSEAVRQVFGAVPFLCSWCDQLHDPERGLSCPCRSTPEPCQCGGPGCDSRPRTARPYLRARTDTASLDETVAAVVRKARRAA